MTCNDSDAVSGPSEKQKKRAAAASADSITTLTEQQWKALTARGFCVVAPSAHNRLPEYYEEDRWFYAYRNGKSGERLVRIAAHQIDITDRGRDLFILQRID